MFSHHRPLGLLCSAARSSRCCISGLEREDVQPHRLGLSTKRASHSTSITAGDAVMVAHSQTGGRACCWPRRGCPTAPNAGYELFDDLRLARHHLLHAGSHPSFFFFFFGGGARSKARVGPLRPGDSGASRRRVYHIVMADPGSFRSRTAPALGLGGGAQWNPPDAGRGGAIDPPPSSLAAVPGMSVERVTVPLHRRGHPLLASGDDGQQRCVRADGDTHRQRQSRDRGKYPAHPCPVSGGSTIVEVSVKASLKHRSPGDQRGPFSTLMSRIENASIRTIRENETAQNLSRDEPHTVQQNIPEEEVGAAPGEQSSEEVQRREDLTNYEISSTQIPDQQRGLCHRKSLDRTARQSRAPCRRPRRWRRRGRDRRADRRNRGVGRIGLPVCAVIAAIRSRSRW